MVGQAEALHLLPGMTAPHFIFVDFENVQSVKLDLISGKPVHVIVVVGRDQTKVPMSLVQQLMEHSGQVKLIQTEVKGKNALDFVLSGEVGMHVARHAGGSFHIISRDKGFDALISHLRATGVEAARHDAFIKVPVLAASGAVKKLTPAAAPAPVKKAAAVRGTPPAQRLEKMKARLAPGMANRPKRLKNLLGLMKDRLGVLTEAESAALLEKLKATGLLSVSATGAVTYPD
jgi:PIN domain